MHRITMSLKSGIEVDESLAALVRITFEAGDDLVASHWPYLCDTLFEKMREMMSYAMGHLNSDGLEDAEFALRMERLNVMFLIIRNMSLNDSNAKRFAAHNHPKETLVQALGMRNHPSLMELKNYALDLTEAMAHSVPYTANDPLFDIIEQGLESNDRGVLLGSMRSICRLIMGRDEFNRIGEIPMKTIRRIISLPMLEDEELVSAALDFMYQYTTQEENIAKLIQASEGYELVRHLVRLLLYQGITGEQLVYIKTVQKERPSFAIPQLPSDIVRELLSLTEPERATKWYVDLLLSSEGGG